MNKEFVINYFKAVSEVMSENRELLIEMDSEVGDGDLGLTMDDGFKAVYNSLKNNEETDLGKLLYQAGKDMSRAVPSTMGTLMASGLMQAGKEFKAFTNGDLDFLLRFFSAFMKGVENRGKAKVGEKTFVDGINGAVAALTASASSSYEELVEEAYYGAVNAYENTLGMLAVHGRAATRGEASRKLKDPGAYVAVLLMKALVSTSKY